MPYCFLRYKEYDKIQLLNVSRMKAQVPSQPMETGFLNLVPETLNPGDHFDSLLRHLKKEQQKLIC